MGAYFTFHPLSWAVGGLNNLHRNISYFSCSGSFSEYFASMHRYGEGSLKVLSIAQGVWSSPWSKLDQLLPNLRLISGVMGRKSVTYLDCLRCRAEELFARGRYLIKFWSYGITNVQGRGRNGLTLLKIFLGPFIWTPLWTLFAKDHGYFFSSSFF